MILTPTLRGNASKHPNKYVVLYDDLPELDDIEIFVEHITIDKYMELETKLMFIGNGTTKSW